MRYASVARRATSAVSMPADFSAAAADILMPGRYSIVSTFALVCPQYILGAFTHATSRKFRRNLCTKALVCLTDGLHTLEHEPAPFSPFEGMALMHLFTPKPNTLIASSTALC